VVKTEDFVKYVRERGRELYRDLPWRHNITPYRVLVSELMLQQTQVDRVVTKFEAFMQRFPDVAALASTSLADVLVLWQGLGYNRRAKYLHEAAKEIVRLGMFPDRLDELTKLPGVGKNTAGAILAYAFNQPVFYIETNVRTVYLHHFFADKTDVSDTEILAKLHETSSFETVIPREWYSALMDYGSYLKKQGFGANAKSKHYKKQSKFQGSLREMRGLILRMLTVGPMSMNDLIACVAGDRRLMSALEQLEKEGFVCQQNGAYMLVGK
jgi:A/G-specific adenine glycosylase